MELSSQEQPIQRSQEELAKGLPEGYPPTREHLKDAEPLPQGLKDRLAEIRRSRANEVTMPPRPARWQQAENAESDDL